MFIEINCLLVGVGVLSRLWLAVLAPHPNPLPQGERGFRRASVSPAAKTEAHVIAGVGLGGGVLKAVVVDGKQCGLSGVGR